MIISGCVFAGTEDTANDAYAYTLQVCFLDTFSFSGNNNNNNNTQRAHLEI